jgi:HAD superfamily hydrolase (TIGR01662 family)
LQAVLFDFDGTLCFRTPSLSDVIDRSIEPYFALSEEKKQASRRYWHYYWAPSAEMIRDEGVFGRSRSDPFWCQYLERYFQVIGVPPKLHKELYPTVLSSIRETPSQETLGHDVIATLALILSLGMKIGLLTNRENSVRSQLEIMGISEFFNVAITAGETGMLKPSPLLFQYAAERMQVDPKDVVYVGDNYYTDIAGAVTAGLEAVLIDPQHVFRGVRCVTISTVGELNEVLPQLGKTI